MPRLWVSSMIVLAAFATGCGLADSTSRRKEPATPEIIKQPANFLSRTFDPASPPPDMPPLSEGETAECDSSFGSNARVSGQSQRSDLTHATLTVAKIQVTLQLAITIWLPAGASDHVAEHEQGHRQIAEYFYQTADQLAAQITTSYMGRQLNLEGSDLNARANKALEQMAAEITAEYNRRLNVEAAQLQYDSITDHSRNGMEAKDAVAYVLKNTPVESASAGSRDPDSR